MGIVTVIYIAFIYFFIYRFIYPLLTFECSAIFYDIVFFCFLFVFYILKKKYW